MSKQEVTTTPRDEARAMFAEHFSYKLINRDLINSLIIRLKQKLASFENNGFKMYVNSGKLQGSFDSEGRLLSFSIRCIGMIQHSPYHAPFVHFDDREAITFGKDGFIGFCGWADNINSKPFLEAFKDWVEAMNEL